MLQELKYETSIELDKVPIQWIPKFELYYPDLPLVPIVYVHKIIGEKRIYGFPASASFESQDEENTTPKILFVCNEDLEKDAKLKQEIKRELEERFGISQKIGIAEVIKSCKGKKEYEDFFKKLWEYISKASGDYVPYGRYYEELYSIVRFVSALAPKTGRQSEMRMLYNFISYYGERIQLCKKWSHLEYYLLPTYSEVLNNKIGEFPRFKKLKEAIIKFSKNYYGGKEKLNEKEVATLNRKVPNKDEDFRSMTDRLVDKKLMTIEEKENLDFLVDAFNRLPLRAFIFIGYIANINEKNDYRKWDKADFKEFYLRDNMKGFSPKPFACFMQQGFGNPEFIPIDEWIGAFVFHTLGFDSLESFFDSFDNLGKLERLMWFASQANKTNIRLFFYTLWCCRYGVSERKLREANPVSCYECELREKCVGFKKIKNKTVDVKGEGNRISSTADFIVITNGVYVPKVVLKRDKKGYVVIDRFSGYILHNEKSNMVGKVVKVEDFINDLPNIERKKNN